jgi:hypothetical protein
MPSNFYDKPVADLRDIANVRRLWVNMIPIGNEVVHLRDMIVDIAGVGVGEGAHNRSGIRFAGLDG